MRVCYFGTYEKEYPINRNVINGLILNNTEVIECHEKLLDDIKNKIDIAFYAKIKIFFSVIIVYLKLIYKKLRLPPVDCVIVGYIGQLDMILARILFPTKKIIFNPMLSIYDTMINDRKVSGNYFTKKFFYLLDKISCSLADKIILDTPEHIEYFRKKFKVQIGKFDFAHIGADDKLFYPIPEENKSAKNFTVLFYGKFTPIHGIEHIIKAAKNLEQYSEIKFEIIGTGQTHKEIIKLSQALEIKNTAFIDWVPFEKLPQKIASADICIGGHFGGSEKAKRVIANKAFQIIAMKKPIIISDCRASISAGFVDLKNCLFCEPENSQALSQAILKLKNNQNLRDEIAKNGYALFQEKFSAKIIGKKLKKIIAEIIFFKSLVLTPAYLIRKKIILNYLRTYKIKIKNFLEIGIGNGDLIKAMDLLAYKGEGIDFSDKTVKGIKKRFFLNIKISKKDFFDIKEKNRYDLIIALELIEHLHDDRKALKRMQELIANQGLLILSVPAHKRRWSVLDEWAGHYRRYEKEELISLLENYGFRIEKFYNYGFPLLNILWFARKNIINQKEVFRSNDENTKRSGTDRNLEKKFKFFFNDFFLSPFYFAQKFFYNFDFSPAYLIIAKKVKNGISKNN